MLFEIIFFIYFACAIFVILWVFYEAFFRYRNKENDYGVHDDPVQDIVHEEEEED
jgi:hypothetical protein